MELRKRLLRGIGQHEVFKSMVFFSLLAVDYRLRPILSHIDLVISSFLLLQLPGLLLQLIVVLKRKGAFDLRIQAALPDLEQLPGLPLQIYLREVVPAISDPAQFDFVQASLLAFGRCVLLDGIRL